MKSLKEFYFENSLYKECINNINEGKDIIELPYTFDIYNEGPKNKDYKITKSNIYKIFFNIGKKKEIDPENGKEVINFVDHYNQMIKLPLPADKITYKEIPNKENTKNWTEIPQIIDYTFAGAWYSNKFKEYNYNQYNKDWNEWFRMIKSYMKGKISVTIQQDFSEDQSDNEKYLIFSINNSKFNNDREEKLKELQNPNNLKKWAEEADAKEKAEIKKREEDELNKKKAAEEWDNWWNSLTDAEKLSWSMGYGRGSGTFTGD